MLDLTARLHPSALDQRRGIVRLHPDALAALGLAPWDVVVLHGARTTAGLVALAPPGFGQRDLLCDELVLGNLGIPDGSIVKVERGPDREAVSVTVNAPQEVLAAVSPEMLRTALLGKALTSGDQVSLLPQDLAPLPAVDVVATRRSLANLLGPAWSNVLLSIAATSPDGASVVTMGTVVGFSGGTTTTGSATPLVLPSSGTPASTALELPGLEAQVASLRSGSTSASTTATCSPSSAPPRSSVSSSRAGPGRASRRWWSRSSRSSGCGSSGRGARPSPGSRPPLQRSRSARCSPTGPVPAAPWS